MHGEGVVEFEILEVREESDEIQYFSASAFGLFEGEELECWREVPKTLLNGWHETGYLKVVDPKLLEVCKRGEVTQVVLAEPLRSEPGITDGDSHADPESFDERKQTELV